MKSRNKLQNQFFSLQSALFDPPHPSRLWVNFYFKHGVKSSRDEVHRTTHGELPFKVNEITKPRCRKRNERKRVLNTFE
jgi:hypothetical protein